MCFQFLTNRVAPVALDRRGTQGLLSASRPLAQHLHFIPAHPGLSPPVVFLPLR